MGEQGFEFTKYDDEPFSITTIHLRINRRGQSEKKSKYFAVYKDNFNIMKLMNGNKFVVLFDFEFDCSLGDLSSIIALNEMVINV
ncbi:hypothetical protein H9L01_10375 [Erysipelothrix inopinata]|uniref:Uncharacterized protein n=1 Tax=Erysipelothrix inopinata TaxID=225084 RepID=A0A7G9RYS6_9FIRM|nr:hypothetical protein [Erysipelothrix inopinata]QNN60751.1 hypothetical protein H9L01_10375 [Erysipelothrix inopinata]